LNTLSWLRKSLTPSALQGEKTFLRPPQFSDFEEWSVLRQQSRAFLERWEPSWSVDEFSRSSFRQRARIYQRRALNDEGHTFFVFDLATGRLVGGLSLSHIRRGVSQSATLGYWMGEPFARQGYMKDAIRAVIRVARPVFGLHRLEAACLPHNENSRHLLLKCGFEPEGFAKAYVKIAGQWEDHLLFGLITD
jgi:[ribosomal protein S5]-alanine N-acetyltransferase